MLRFELGLLVGVGVAVAGCGGSALSEGTSAGSGGAPMAASGGGGAPPNGGGAGLAAGGATGGASSMGASAGAASVCPPGVPSAAEIASTPRADTNLELFALRQAPSIIAPQATYDRIVRDVGAIRMQDPTVANIDYFEHNDGRSLDIRFDVDTFDQIQTHGYHAWDCLNQSYVTKSFAFDSELQTVSIVLKGIYDLQRVADQYATLDGVLEAYPGGAGGGDGPTICLTVDGDTWHYVFDEAGGDCPAGCTEHSYTHFTTSAAGMVTPLGALPPELVDTYASEQACRAY